MNLLDYKTLKALPKVELHLHLDASVRPSTVKELGEEYNIPMPDDIENGLIAPPICENLADYISRVDLALTVMQEAEALTRIAYELVEDIASENVIYAEVRFAPQLHTRSGLTKQEVINAVREALEEGERVHRVKTNLILCCLRHEPGEVSIEVVKLAIANRERGNKVVGIDLAADEANFPAHLHQEAFQLAIEADLHRTVHAGEVAGAESIRQALDLLKAERLGHGVRLKEDRSLMRRVKEERIALEMCPTSNYQTRAIDSFANYPISDYLKEGIMVTVNTDARTISNTTLTGEYQLLVDNFGWAEEEIMRVTLNGIESAFIEEEIKKELVDKFEMEWIADIPHFPLP